jgi:hypothetical protein
VRSKLTSHVPDGRPCGGTLNDDRWPCFDVRRHRRSVAMRQFNRPANVSLLRWYPTNRDTTLLALYVGSRTSVDEESGRDDDRDSGVL